MLDDVIRRRQVICAALTLRGHTVIVGSTPHESMEALDSFDPDVVLVGLTDAPPGPLIARLRADRPRRVVFLATRTSTSSARLAATKAGADAVVVEPFVVDELVASVETMMSWGAKRAAVHEARGLMIDEAAHRVTVDGIEVGLTVTEFRLLLFMVRHRDRVLSKRTLLEQVWGFGEYAPNVVEVHVSALRRKLQRAGRCDILETVRGVGYVIRHARPAANVAGLAHLDGHRPTLVGVVAPEESLTGSCDVCARAGVVGHDRHEHVTSA